MSTKTYDGIRFRVQGLEQLHKEITEMRKELRPLVEQKVIGFIANDAIHRVDRYARGRRGEDESCALSEATPSLLDRQSEVERSKRRDPQVNFTFSLSILPIDGGILGIPFVEQRNFLQILLEKDWVEPFGYWDNTDPDPSLSEEEWDERRRLWDKALSAHNGIPALNGFSADLVLMSQGGLPSAEEIATYIAENVSLEGRARRAALDDLIEERVRQRMEGEQGEPRFSMYIEAMEHFNSSEQGMQELDERTKKHGSLLIPEITKEVLLRKATDFEVKLF